MRCRCGSSKVETEAASGTTFCVACGEVLEENNIVSEVTFQESSGGKTVLSGSFAGESGRLKIAKIAYALRLPERYREAAQRYYNLAVINRFTRGRKSEHVAAANVFVLGSTFLKLVRTLNLKLPLIDPSIYISRFAAALDFGEYTQRVAQDAVRLVQRMDRDWIRTGRRPAGICGACLLIAARINGFRRTTREVIYVVKVAEITIHTRLKEFRETESANLSVRDFKTMWLEKEADPPAFVKARKEQTEKEKRRGHETEDAGREEAGERNDKEDDETQVPRRMPAVIAASPSAESPMTTTAHSPPASDAVPTQSEDTQTTLIADTHNTNSDVQVTDTQVTAVNPELAEQVEELEQEVQEWMKSDDFIKSSEQFEKEAIAAEAMLQKTEEIEEVSLSDVDDEEIEAMILSPEEVKVKSIIWYNENKEYLEELRVRTEKAEMDRKNGIISKRGKHNKKRKLPPASSPAEAAKQLLQTKKFSRKINQAVFDGMFESAESIEKIKEIDKLKEVMRSAGLDENTGDYSAYEVVEESGDLVSTKKAAAGEEGKLQEHAEQEVADEDEDDEDMDLDDMADDERLMLEGRRRMGWADADPEEDYYDYD
ncbi:hypothetical protein BX666DRAFT_1851284 [Dichotomocladium elegans]|nr:hypothetical protein BX666DRAFT_1851284 [Dichotomocladium elegans]